MKICLSLFFLLPTVAFAVSARSLVVQMDTPRSAVLPKDKLKETEVREDIEVLIESIQRGYGGWVPFKKQLEDEIFPGLRKLKSNSTANLCLKIASVLEKINDNHLSAHFAGNPKKCGEAPERQGRVGLNVQVDKTLPWGYFERSAGPRKVAIISVVRGALDTSEGWKGFLEKASEV